MVPTLIAYGARQQQWLSIMMLSWFPKTKNMKTPIKTSDGDMMACAARVKPRFGVGVLFFIIMIISRVARQPVTCSSSATASSLFCSFNIRLTLFGGGARRGADSDASHANCRPPTRRVCLLPGRVLLSVSLVSLAVDICFGDDGDGTGVGRRCLRVGRWIIYFYIM